MKKRRLVLLSVLILALAGYIIYSLMNKPDTNLTNSSSNNSVSPTPVSSSIPMISTSPSVTPTPLTKEVKVTSISIGSSNGVALSDDGMVWTWGSNNNGQLGNGSKDDTSIPQKIKGLTNVISVFNGDDYMLALKKDGTVWTWGIDTFSEENKQSSSPVQIKSLIDIVAIDSKMALQKDGTVWTWGNNEYGEIGDGTKGILSENDTGNYTYDEVNKFKSAPVHVKELTDIVKITAGNQYKLAIKKDGTVWAWGRTKISHLGISKDSVEITIPQKVKDITDVVDISGRDSIRAVKGDGTVWQWGDFYFPTQLAEMKDVVKVTSGSLFFMILQKEGNVWAWGGNRFGEIGEGTYEPRSAPLQIKALTNVIDISGKASSGAAITKDGTVWTWGKNDHGQLGDGTTINQNLPKKITFK